MAVPEDDSGGVLPFCLRCKRQWAVSNEQKNVNARDVFVHGYTGASFMILARQKCRSW